MIQHKIVSIQGIDTRALVEHVRKEGAMNCIISSEIQDINILKQKLSEVPSMEGLELASRVSTQQEYVFGDEGNGKKIAVLDFGVKKNILNCLAQRGAYLKVFPAKTTFEECEQFNPQAYFVSNGPGDPATMSYAIETIKKILQSGKPLFGICLGHQLLALAHGGKTYKMHHGHRGLNHPVYNVETGKSEITTQNHGFAVDKSSVDTNEALEITHINLNDDTLEGISVKGKPAFSVQFHPEANPGPHDSHYLFDQFLALI